MGGETVKSIGAFEAKTNFNKLLQRVAEGETIEITRRGVLIAKLVPVEAPHVQNPRDAAREILALRKGLSLGGIKIRDLIDEGRHH